MAKVADAGLELSSDLYGTFLASPNRLELQPGCTSIRKSSWVNAYAIITASLIGIGVLGLPQAFSVLGWGPSMACLLFFALGAMYSGTLLTRLVVRVRPRPQVYADLGEAAFGLIGRRVVMVLGYTYLTGTIISIHLTAAIALQQWVLGTFGLLLRLVTCSVSFAAIALPILQVRTLHTLSWSAGVLGIICILIPVVTLCILLEQEKPEDTTVMVATGSYAVLGTGVSDLVFAYAGQILFVETMAEMQNPQDFRYAVQWCVLTMVVVYLAISVVGYSRLGRSAIDPVTSNVSSVHSSTKAFINGLLFIHGQWVLFCSIDLSPQELTCCYSCL
jgi:amino acid permease